MTGGFEEIQFVEEGFLEFAQLNAGINFYSFDERVFGEICGCVGEEAFGELRNFFFENGETGSAGVAAPRDEDVADGVE